MMIAAASRDTLRVYRSAARSSACWNAAFDSSNGLTFQDHDPRIVTDGLGSWLAVWARGAPDGDVFVARSTDDGGTWTNPVPLHTNAARDTGADVDPTVATDGNGRWAAVWTSSEDLEKTFIAEAAQAGMVGIKGHRSVGGIRTSIYNAMEPADVEKFVDFAKAFAKGAG